MKIAGFLKVPFLSPRRRDISYLLSTAVERRTPSDRVVWLEDVLSWVRTPGKVTALSEDESPTPSTSIQAARMKYILHLLERQPTWRADVSVTLGKLVAEMRATDLFCDAGIFSDQGVIEQLNTIAIEAVFPAAVTNGDLDEIVTELFPSEGDVQWVEGLTPVLVKRIMRLIEGDAPVSEIWWPLRRAFGDGMLIMAAQAAGAATDRSMRIRVPVTDIPTSPFFRLLGAVQRLHPRLEGSAWVGPDDTRELDDLIAVIGECVKMMERAFAYLEANGVSISLVFRFERIELLLERLLLMARFLKAASAGLPEAEVGRLMGALIRASLDGHRVGRIFDGKLRLLSRRIVDHTGDSGDHYITRDRSGYLQMLLSAAGGGFLTVGTTIIKAGIGRFTLPAVVEALAHAANFSISFLVMQFAHFTLATKQPSMTASTLARKMAGFAHGTETSDIVMTIRDAFRSQFAAALGNVGMALPTAALVTWLYGMATGEQVFTDAYAHKSLASLNPLSTLTIFFAALTGVCLWLASALGGAFENWVSLHQIPLRMARNRRLGALLGVDRLVRLNKFVVKHLPGASVSVALGFLLAFLPFLSRITGIPLDVRHVTLSSAALATSAMTLGPNLVESELQMAAIGIVITAAMNFGVSFFLALFVASRAQNVHRGLLAIIGIRLWRLFLREPLSFFWPTRTKLQP